MELLILGLITGGATVFGYMKSRSFVRSRLRFVDGIENPVAPWVAGGLAAAIATPVVLLLPVVGVGSALVFGAGIGLGVRHGAKDVRRLPGL